jgi:two-component system response regulator FixJ
MTDDTSPEVAVIDDDAAVLDSFRFMLEIAGFRVATFDSAIAYLAGGDVTPRCLILDQNMPDMTGLELIGRLRAAGSEIPIMLITSAPSPALVARAAQIGAAYVLEKPPTEEELIAFVRGIAGLARQ